MLAFAKKKINIKVEGVIKEVLLQEALEKLENALEHVKRNF